MTKVGIRRENKEFELRTPIIPAHVQQLSKKYGLNFTVEPSDQRAFSEETYQKQGASVGELRESSIPVIFGIKEIPNQEFEPDKVYLFFSHVIKGQSHNMPMLRQILDIGATLIDYERIVNIETGRRLVFFGNWAGYAGMAETLLAFGQRLKVLGIVPNPFERLRPTYEYKGLQDLQAAIHTCGERIKKEGVPSELRPLVAGFIG